MNALSTQPVPPPAPTFNHTLRRMMEKAANDPVVWKSVTKMLTDGLARNTEENRIFPFFSNCPFEEMREELISGILDHVLAIYPPEVVLEHRRLGKRLGYKPRHIVMMHWMLSGLETLQPAQALKIMQTLRKEVPLPNSVYSRLSKMQEIIAGLERDPNNPEAQREAAWKLKELGHPSPVRR